MFYIKYYVISNKINDTMNKIYITSNKLIISIRSCIMCLVYRFNV